MEKRPHSWHGFRVTTKDVLRNHPSKVDDIRRRVRSRIGEYRSKEATGLACAQAFDHKPMNLRSLDGLIREA